MRLVWRLNYARVVAILEYLSQCIDKMLNDPE